MAWVSTKALIKSTPSKLGMMKRLALALPMRQRSHSLAIRVGFLVMTFLLLVTYRGTAWAEDPESPALVRQGRSQLTQARGSSSCQRT